MIAHRHGVQRFLAACLAAALSLQLAGLPVLAADLPVDPSVVHGKVSFQVNGLSMAISQASAKAIVNWQSFSIGEGNSVNVLQPSSSAAMLSRVVGDDPSAIMGRLEANGIFYLINPQGILFGPNAIIDVRALTVSTLDLSDEDFIAGRDVFAGDSTAGIVNYGLITSRERVALLARQVENHGSIRASETAIAAAEKVVVGHAAGGKLTLDLSGLRGTVRNKGEINASGSQGGTVIIAADTVEQLGVIRADGQAGSGGVVDVRGRTEVEVGTGAVMSASAITLGNGGTIHVVSEGSAHVRPGAVIAAEGGTQNGDGGFVEVSGHGYLALFGTLSAAAPAGAAGLVFIDPTDVLISDTDADVGMTGNPDFAPDGAPADAVISLATLNQGLAGSNVTITTTSAGADKGDISIEIDPAARITSASYSLTLLADRDIELANGGIELAAGTLTMRAGQTDATGAIILNGVVSAAVLDLIAAGSVVGGSLTATAGNMVITALAGAIDLEDLSAANGTVTISALGDAVMGAVTAGGALQAGAGDDLVITGTVEATGPATFTGDAVTITGALSATAVTCTATGTAALAGVTATGPLKATSEQGHVTFTGVINASDTVQVTGKTGISLGQVMGQAPVTLDSDAGISITGAASATTWDLTAAGGIELQDVLQATGGNVVAHAGVGNLTQATTATISGTGAVTLNGAGISVGRVIAGTTATLNGTGAVNTQAISAATLLLTSGTSAAVEGEMNITGNAQVTAVMDAQLSAAIEVGGTLTIHAGEAVDLAGAVRAQQLTAEAGTNLTASEDVTATGDVSLKGPSLLLALGTITAGGGVSAVSTGGNVSLGGVQAGNTGAEVRSNGTLTVFDEVRAAGPVALEAGGVMNTAGVISEAGLVDIDGRANVLLGGVSAFASANVNTTGDVVVGGDVTAGQGVSVTGASLTAEALDGRSVTVRTTGDTNVTSAEADDALELTATNGDLTVGDVITSAGTATVRADNGDISVGSVSSTGTALMVAGGLLTVDGAVQAGSFDVTAGTGVSLQNAPVAAETTLGGLSITCLGATDAIVRLGGSLDAATDLTLTGQLALSEDAGQLTAGNAVQINGGIDAEAVALAINGQSLTIAGNTLDDTPDWTVAAYDGTAIPLTTLAAPLYLTVQEATGIDPEVEFAALDGQFALTIRSESSTNADVTLGAADIGSLSLQRARRVRFEGPVTTAQDVDVTDAVGPITVTSTGSLQAGGPVLLENADDLDNVGIEVAGPIAAAGDVILQATKGDVLLGANVTADGTLRLEALLGSVAVTNVDLTAGEHVQIKSPVNVAGCIAAGSGAVTFESGVTLTGTTRISSQAGGITFMGPVNGGFNLSLEAGGALVAEKAIGEGVSLGSIEATAASISVGNVHASGAQGQAGGNITLAAAGGDATVGEVNSSGGTALDGVAGQDAGSVTLSATGALSVGAINASGTDAGGGTANGGTGGAISLSGASVILGGSMAATGGDGGASAVGGQGGSITVNGPGRIADGLDLLLDVRDGAQVAATRDTNSAVAIGSLDGTTGGFAESLLVEAGSRQVELGPVGATTPLTADVMIKTTGELLLNGGIAVDGAAGIDLSSTAITRLKADSTFSASDDGETIRFGALTGGQSLTVDAGEADVDFGGAIDSLTGLNVSEAGSLAFRGPVEISGDLSVRSTDEIAGAITVAAGLASHSGAISLSAPLSVADSVKLGSSSAAHGNVTIDGNLLLTGNVTLQSSTGDVRVDGTTTGGHELAVQADGSIDFVGPIGDNAPLAAVSLAGAAVDTGSISTFGPVVVTATTGNVGIGKLTVDRGDARREAARAKCAETVVQITAKQSLTATGAMTVDGGVELTAQEISVGGQISSSCLALTADGSVILGQIRVEGDASLASRAGDLTIASLTGKDVQITGDGALTLGTVTASGTFSVTCGADATLADVTATGDLQIAAKQSLTATGAMTVDGGVELTAREISVGGQVSSSCLALTADGSVVLGQLRVEGDASLASGAGDLTIASLTAKDVQITGDGALTLGTVTASGMFSAAGDAGVTLAGVNATGDLQITTEGRLSTTGALTTQGALNVTSGQAADIAGPVSAGGSITIGSGGELTLGGTVTAGTDVLLRAVDQLLVAGLVKGDVIRLVGNPGFIGTVSAPVNLQAETRVELENGVPGWTTTEKWAVLTGSAAGSDAPEGILFVGAGDNPPGDITWNGKSLTDDDDDTPEIVSARQVPTDELANTEVGQATLPSAGPPLGMLAASWIHRLHEGPRVPGIISFRTNRGTFHLQLFDQLPMLPPEWRLR